MKKIFAAICFAVLGFSLHPAEPGPEKLALGGNPFCVEINREGYITHYLNDNAMFSLMLQVHWLHFAHQSKDLQIAMQGKNAFRSVGSFANLRFSSRTRLQNGRAETEYQLELTGDNTFPAFKQWEVTPFFSMHRLKMMENCTYSAVCVDGGMFNGRIRDIVNFPGRVRSFTIHGIQGYDLTLDFPDGAQGVDRRREAHPYGLWFFVPAVMSNGSYPRKAGDRAVLRVNVEVKEGY